MPLDTACNVCEMHAVMHIWRAVDSQYHGCGVHFHAFMGHDDVAGNGRTICIAVKI